MYSIKVCGMRDADNIRAVDALSVDWLGFIFWSRSSRYVDSRPSYLPLKAKRMGVFVDATADDVQQHIIDYGLQGIQLHGHESIDYIRALRSSAIMHNVRLVKAVSVAGKNDIEACMAYENIVDSFLFDTKCSSVGGSGQQFDWSVLNHYRGSTPFILSGGIGPDDAHRLKAFSHPRCTGIDLNSRFETAPALKDIGKLKTFLNTIRHNE